MEKLSNVSYVDLDRVKLACIEAAKQTLSFAEDWGQVVDEHLGASANLFALHPNLQGRGRLVLSLISEGLGTADDARPSDLSPTELREFWYNIAFKTLASLTNDAASSCLRPLLVSLYLPSSTPEAVFDEHFLDGFLSGFVEACRRVKCVYLSGETPQLKGKIYPGVLDIAGAVVGVLPKPVPEKSSSSVKAGSAIVLVESSGPHENGFTSLRALAETLPQGYRTRLPNGEEYWKAINKASMLYSPLVQMVLASGLQPLAIENITGHGWQKLMRSREPLEYVIEDLIPIPQIFHFVREWSNSSWQEMFSVFNCGAGLALYLESRDDAERVVELAAKGGLRATLAGTVRSAPSRRVTIPSLGVTLEGEEFCLSR